MCALPQEPSTCMYLGTTRPLGKKWILMLNAMTFYPLDLWKDFKWFIWHKLSALNRRSVNKNTSVQVSIFPLFPCVASND